MPAPIPTYDQSLAASPSASLGYSNPDQPYQLPSDIPQATGTSNNLRFDLDASPSPALFRYTPSEIARAQTQGGFDVAQPQYQGGVTWGQYQGFLAQQNALAAAGGAQIDTIPPAQTGGLETGTYNGQT